MFEAFTESSQLVQWWGPKGFTTPTAEMDVRVGGKYRFGMQAPSGDVMYLTGEYREVSPPGRLVFTWMWETGDMAGQETLVTLEFTERGTSTEVELTHELFGSSHQRDMHGEGWGSSYDCLSELVDG